MITADVVKTIIYSYEIIKREEERKKEELFIKNFEKKYNKLINDLQNEIINWANKGISSLNFIILPEYNYGKEFNKTKDEKQWAFIRYLVHYGYYVVYYRSSDIYLISSNPIYIDGLNIGFKACGTIKP